jgi:hypothetical protein
MMTSEHMNLDDHEPTTFSMVIESSRKVRGGRIYSCGMVLLLEYLVRVIVVCGSTKKKNLIATSFSNFALYSKGE